MLLKILNNLKKYIWVLAIFMIIASIILLNQGGGRLFLKHIQVNFWNLLIPIVILVIVLQNGSLRAFVKSKKILSGFIIIYFLALGNVSYFNQKIKSSTIQEILKTDTIGIENRLPIFAKDSLLQVKSLIIQAKMMQSRKKEYLLIAGNYYSFMFFFSICLAVFSTLSTLIIIYIAKDGWANDNDKIELKIIFAICLVTSAISYIVPKTLNNESNFKQNMGSYYLFDKQVVSTIEALDYHHNNRNEINFNHKLDSIINKNYEFMKSNVNRYLDIDLTEATKDFKNVFKGNGNGQ